ncbi:VOC family protein [Hahella ganghwensis]|uniref:VOC family protein n=1 Tax=Hahella ganghwensis TaxID=286420 RepID=UPI0003777BC2|nr:VOC family protein [Hahella ganghwensis]
MAFPNLALSHFELFVNNVDEMEHFYRETLGFIVTDRGKGEGAMVFLSRSPEEHHQLVLNPQSGFKSDKSPLDHLSFRVASLSDLRQFYLSLSKSEVSCDTVSHGTAWSIYFRDPEGNRLEIFTDTPWYVHQPCKFKVDLSLSDDALYAYTEAKVSDMPGFCAVSEWSRAHQASV